MNAMIDWVEDRRPGVTTEPTEAERVFEDEGASAAPSASEPETFLQENWLFVLPLAMFVLLGACAMVMALT